MSVDEVEQGTNTISQLADDFKLLNIIVNQKFTLFKIEY